MGQFSSHSTRIPDVVLVNGYVVVDIGRPELYTNAYSTLEEFRIEALGALGQGRVWIKRSNGVFLQIYIFFHFRYSTWPFLTSPRVTLLILPGWKLNQKHRAVFHYLVNIHWVIVWHTVRTTKRPGSVSLPGKYSVGSCVTYSTCHKKTRQCFVIW